MMKLTECGLDQVERNRQDKLALQNRIQSMVSDFNHLVEEERYAEAQILADQAFDWLQIWPEVVALKEKAGVLYNVARNERNRLARERGFLDTLAEVDMAAAPNTHTSDPIRFNDPKQLVRTFAPPFGKRSRSQIRQSSRGTYLEFASPRTGSG